MKALDWTHLYTEHKGEWVALSAKDRITVIGFGKTLKAAMADAAKKNPNQKPSFTRVPESLSPAISIL